MIKATHRGNCQVCGHQHHVMGTVLAKHGYTVTFGYFQGTCRGSEKQPVQTERTITDATVVGLGEYALECDASAEKVRTGEVTPKRILTGQKYNHETYKYEPVYIAFADGTQEQQAKAVKLAIMECESDARHARGHAVMLTQMANKLFGTALVSLDDLMIARAPAPKAVVDVKAAKVHGAFGSKAARKDELDKINRAYSKQIDLLQDVFLAIPHAQRTDAMSEVYYAPMYPHQWKARHSAAALKVFPQAKDIVATIEELVRAREAVKAAP